MIVLPNIELVSELVHESWVQAKKTQGFHSRKAEDGEELMVPYNQLSEKAKDLDRNTVKAVYKAIKDLQH
jgi:RyR domain.